MNLSLERRWRSDKCTIGDLFIDGLRECYILEDKVRQIDLVDVDDWKVQNETAIPAGRYRVVKDFSNRFQRITLHLINVPGFSGIRIHPGNTSVDTDGCLLPGTARVDSTSVTGSKDACSNLEAKVFAALDKGEEVWISVQNPYGASPDQMEWLV